MDSILLCGMADGVRFKRRFIIDSKIEPSGASAMCYSAHNMNTGSGVLKEFYPRAIKSLTRDESGQVILPDECKEEKEEFKRLQNDYLEPYKMMIFERSNPELAVFVPAFEIYYGCDEDCNIIGTSYIWTPDPQLMTYSEFCRDIHDHPTINPEKKLFDILLSIETLAKCICAFHKANLLHRDIKPDNFGFKKSGKEILPQTLSMFDVDTVSSVYNVPPYAVGAYGFMEPEAINDYSCNLSDIFSIGAVLFYSVIVNDGLKHTNYRYDYKYYNNLRTLLETSDLIKCSRRNSNEKLKSTILKILQKTLCTREHRYTSCEELLADIKNAIYFAAPGGVAAGAGVDNEWMLMEESATIKNQLKKKSLAAIQHHLFTKPIYENIDSKKDTINILLIGLSTAGIQFLDTTLQIMQIPGKKINVTVISKSKEDTEKYLKDRPDLNVFFGINQADTRDEMYGRINFITHTFSVDTSNENQKYINELFSDDSEKPDYVFVAAGRDADTLAIVKSFALPCQTCFVWKESHFHERELGGLIPVYTSDDVKSTYEYMEIERMALNVHLIWNKNLNIKFGDVRNEFKKDYYHHSCVSFVIAAKYKLYSVGIDMDIHDLSKAANEYSKYINENEEDKNALVYMEHRRWIVEKVCTGYTNRYVYECADGKTKTDKGEHVCLVRSSPIDRLSKGKWIKSTGKINKELWDTGGDYQETENALTEYEKLDELEKVSVDLHCVFMEQANRLEVETLFDSNIINGIRRRLSGHRTSLSVFHELITCMKDIWNGETDQCKRYAGLVNSCIAFIKNDEDINVADRKWLKESIETLDKQFKIVKLSREYHNYKNDDIALVEGIPFIFTYSSEICLAIPFIAGKKMGDRTELFSNVAVPTIVNPERIIYTAYCNNIKDMQRIVDTLKYISQYMDRKQLRSKIEFIIGTKISKEEYDFDELVQELREASDCKVQRVRFEKGKSLDEFIPALEKKLTDKAKKTPWLYLEKNRSPLSTGTISTSAIVSRMYSSIGSYHFDSSKMMFDDISGADVFRYVKMNTFITVSDVFALHKSTNVSGDKPEFYENYGELWNKYSSSNTNKGAWKFLCGILKNYASNHDTYVKFEISDRDVGLSKPNVYKYRLSNDCRRSAVRILEALKQQNMIGKNSTVKIINTGSCMVSVECYYHWEEKFRKLFDNEMFLRVDDYIKIDINPKYNIVKVVFDDLRVVNCPVKNDRDRELNETGYSILSFLSKNGYIRNYSVSEDKKSISFIYATTQIKDLLTLEGRILEVYIYHKLKSCGYFDDIRSSFEINWENNFSKNEFDCIVTKGFSTVFIECKATGELSLDYYTKLFALSNTFGINMTAVIVADCIENEENQQLIEHGEDFNIITISGKNIKNVSSIVLEILNN